MHSAAAHLRCSNHLALAAACSRLTGTTLVDRLSASSVCHSAAVYLAVLLIGKACKGLSDHVGFTVEQNALLSSLMQRWQPGAAVDGKFASCMYSRCCDRWHLELPRC